MCGAGAPANVSLQSQAKPRKQNWLQNRFWGRTRLWEGKALAVPQTPHKSWALPPEGRIPTI
jgi:hypothetical protein